MKIIPNARLFAFAVVVSVVGALSAAAPARANYAAVAYSSKTHSYGYGYGYATRAGAELEALLQCDGDDARIVAWAENEYVALAVSRNGAYGYGWGTSQEIADGIALAECLDHGGVRPRIVVSVYSGD
jgi:hypothetical protein